MADVQIGMTQEFKDFIELVKALKEVGSSSAPESVEPKRNLHAIHHSKYCIIRTYSAGVHVGILVDSDYDTVVLKESRRVHYWANGESASLSQMCMDGLVKGSSETRVAICIPQAISINGAIEVLPCSEKAEKSLREVATWKV